MMAMFVFPYGKNGKIQLDANTRIFMVSSKILKQITGIPHFQFVSNIYIEQIFETHSNYVHKKNNNALPQKCLH